jgi:hypothetical protein
MVTGPTEPCAALPQQCTSPLVYKAQACSALTLSFEMITLSKGDPKTIGDIPGNCKPVASEPKLLEPEVAVSVPRPHCLQGVLGAFS